MQFEIFYWLFVNIESDDATVKLWFMFVEKNWLLYQLFLMIFLSNSTIFFWREPYLSSECDLFLLAINAENWILKIWIQHVHICVTFASDNCWKVQLFETFASDNCSKVQLFETFASDNCSKVQLCATFASDNCSKFQLFAIFPSDNCSKVKYFLRLLLAINAQKFGRMRLLLAINAQNWILKI